MLVLGAGTMSAAQSVGVQLWSGGPYFAECNVGATKPEESGYYFWWGDTVGYKRNGNSWDAVDGSKTGFTFWASYYYGSYCPTYGCRGRFDDGPHVLPIYTLPD